MDYAGARKAENMKLTALQKRILENGRRFAPSIGFNSGDIARALKQPQRTIVVNLAILEEAGKVTHKGAAWYIVS